MPTTEAIAAQIPKSLSAIRVAALKVATASELDLYTIGEDGKHALFRSRDYHVSHEDYERLEAKGIQTLYVADDVLESLAKQLRGDLTTVLSNEEFSSEERFQVLQFAVEGEISNAFRRLDPDEAVYFCDANNGDSELNAAIEVTVTVIHCHRKPPPQPFQRP